MKTSRNSFFRRIICVVLAVAVTAFPAPVSAESIQDFPLLYSNFNEETVKANPSAAAMYTPEEDVTLAAVTTYHWNGGKGSTPGTVSIYTGGGGCVGSWQTRARTGSGVPANVYWDAFTDVELKAGTTYYIEDSDYSTWSCNAESGNAGFFELRYAPAPDAEKAYVDEDGFAHLGTTSDISVTYTAAERKAAPKKETDIKASDTVVSCGDITVDFSYSLLGEDKLTIVDLPEKTDEKAGYRLKAYDFFLASGQDEFPVEVVITVPKDKRDNEFTYWASYNEETGEWERLYSETSEDGKSDLVYTTHFSDKAKVNVLDSLYRQITGWLNDREEMPKMSAENLRGLFYLYGDADLKDRPVYVISAEALEKYMDDAVSRSIEEFETAAKSTPKDTLVYSSDFVTDLFGWNMDAQNGVTATDTGNSVGTLAKEGLKKAARDGVKFAAGSRLSTVGKGVSTLANGLGKVIAPVAAALATWSYARKIILEMDQGKSFLQAAYNHKLDYLSAGVAWVGCVPGLNIPAAVAGLSLAAASWAYEKYTGRELSVNEKAYRSYYTPGGYDDTWLDNRKADYDSNRVFYYMAIPENLARGSDFGVIKKLKELTPAEDAKLQEVIRKIFGLSAYDTRSVCADMEKYSDYIGNKEWAVVLHTLFKICEGDPARLTKVVKQFYENYANACWEDMETFRAVDKAFREHNGYSQAETSAENQENYKNNYIAELMRVHGPIILDIVKSYEHSGAAELTEAVSGTLQELLNTKMEFRVVDENIAPDENGDRFSGSKYALDYNYLEGNDKGSETGYDKYRVTMKFAKGNKPVKAPVFLPNIKYSETDTMTQCDPYLYYPHWQNFMPRYEGFYKKDNDVVFTCTVYHYLLMGAPDTMIFTDVSNPGSQDVPVPFTIPDTGEDGKIHVTVTIPKTDNTKRLFYYDSNVRKGQDNGDSQFRTSGYGNLENSLSKAFENCTCELNGNEFKIYGTATVSADEYVYLYQYRDEGSAGGSSAATFEINGTINNSTKQGSCSLKATVTESVSIDESWHETSQYLMKQSTSVNNTWEIKAENQLVTVEVKGDTIYINCSMQASVTRHEKVKKQQFVKGPYSDGWTEVDPNSSSNNVDKTGDYIKTISLTVNGIQ